MSMGGKRQREGKYEKGNDTETKAKNGHPKCFVYSLRLKKALILEYSKSPDTPRQPSLPSQSYSRQ